MELLVATQVLPVAGHAKVVNNPELIFSQDISNATYIAYSSDRNVVGFQLNGALTARCSTGCPRCSFQRKKYTARYKGRVRWLCLFRFFPEENHAQRKLWQVYGKKGLQLVLKSS